MYIDILCRALFRPSYRKKLTGGRKSTFQKWEDRRLSISWGICEIVVFRDCRTSHLNSFLTLSRLWTTYVVQRTEIFQKFAVQAVLELCAHCRYQHMRIELLFHVVFSTSCFEVRFVQYCRKKSDRLMMTSRSL